MKAVTQTVIQKQATAIAYILLRFRPTAISDAYRAVLIPYEGFDRVRDLTFVQASGPQAKLKAVISMITKLIMTFPNVGLTSPPGRPRHPIMKILAVIIKVVVKSSGRRGILLAHSTAAKTVTICIVKTIMLIRKGSLRPIAWLNTVQK